MIRAGLCGNCAHVRRVVSGRGSEFLMCGRAKSDPRYPRYPSLPVLVCPGHEPVDPDSEERPSS